MIRKLNAGVLTWALVVFHGAGLQAQIASAAAPPSPASPSSPIFSIGQPPIWRHQLTAQGTVYSHGGQSGATFSYGVFHSLNKPPIQAFNPVLGVIGGTLEGYASIG